MALPPPPAGYVPPVVNAPDPFMARAQAFGLKPAAKPAPAPAPAPAAAAAPPLPPLPALPPLPPGAAVASDVPSTLPVMAGPDAPSAFPGGGGTGGAVAAATAAFAGLSIASDAGGSGGSGAAGSPAAAASAARQQKVAAALSGPKIARKPDIDTLPRKPTPAVHVPADATPHERMTLAGDAAFAAEMGAVFDKIEAAESARDQKAGKSSVCGVCQKPLRTNPPTQLVEAGDESYHEQCFKCHGCGKKLSGEVLTIAGKFYHTPCLVCRHCKCSLVGADFHVSPINEQLYCKLHARVPLGGNTCAGCQQSIPGTDAAVSAGDKTYHPACFVCAYCSESLTGKQCFIKDGDAYCENDYKTLFGVRCGGCKELITGGQCLTVGEKKVRFHPNCFACANAGCKVPLRGKPFYFKADNVFCGEHK